MKVLDEKGNTYFECDNTEGHMGDDGYQPERRYSTVLPPDWIMLKLNGKERTYCCWAHAREGAK